MAKRTRLYWRKQGGTARAYADLREFADVGGAREALRAPGSLRATDDEPTAQALLTARLEELGHGSLAMVERIYGHLGQARHRARVVEFPAKLAKAAGDARMKARSDKHVVTVTPVGYRKSLLRP